MFIKVGGYSTYNSNTIVVPNAALTPESIISVRLPDHCEYNLKFEESESTCKFANIGADNIGIYSYDTAARLYVNRRDCGTYTEILIFIEGYIFRIMVINDLTRKYEVRGPTFLPQFSGRMTFASETAFSEISFVPCGIELYKFKFEPTKNITLDVPKLNSWPECYFKIDLPEKTIVSVTLH